MSTITPTAAFAQYRRSYAATVTTANTNYSSPLNTALLAVAGPDGSLVTHMASVARATIAQTQMQFYMSKDGGATFSLMTSSVIQPYTITQTSQIGGITATQIDATAISETNPIPLGGQTDFGSTTTPCGTSGGAANAQTLPFGNVAALTQYSVFDFEAGLTNTAGVTMAIGTTPATTMVRDITGSSLSAGDLTAGFRYRCWYDGAVLRLIITDRLYVATGITLAGGITTTAQIADF